MLWDYCTSSTHGGTAIRCTLYAVTVQGSEGTNEHETRVKSTRVRSTYHTIRSTWRGPWTLYMSHRNNMIHGTPSGTALGPCNCCARFAQLVGLVYPWSCVACEVMAFRSSDFGGGSSSSNIGRNSHRRFSGLDQTMRTDREFGFLLCTFSTSSIIWHEAHARYSSRAVAG